MSEKREDDDTVDERLCNSRRATIREEINGIKKTVYVAFTVSMLWITVLELILRYYKP